MTGDAALDAALDAAMDAAMDAAIDANAYIAFAGGDPAAAAAIGGAGTLYLPAAVLGELLYGALNSGRPQRNAALVRAFAARCVLLPVTEAVAARYAEVRISLRQQGRPIPENDVWIAATCLEAALPLLTADIHFSAVDGLTVRGW